MKLQSVVILLFVDFQVWLATLLIDCFAQGSKNVHYIFHRLKYSSELMQYVHPQKRFQEQIFE